MGGGSPAPEPPPADRPLVTDPKADELAKRRASLRSQRTSRTGLVIQPSTAQPMSTGLNIPGPGY